MTKKHTPKTTADEQKLVLGPGTPADATMCDSHQLAKTVQFRRVGWCAAGIRLETPSRLLQFYR